MRFKGVLQTHPQQLFPMHDFNNFLNIGCSEAAAIMGEPIEINGQVVNAVFDEEISEWDMDEFGDRDNPELKLGHCIFGHWKIAK